MVQIPDLSLVWFNKQTNSLNLNEINLSQAIVQNLTNFQEQVKLICVQP